MQLVARLHWSVHLVGVCIGIGIEAHRWHKPHFHGFMRIARPICLDP